MTHPSVDNRTGFVFEPLFVADEEGRPVVAALIKATYDLRPSGGLQLAPEQQPALFAGVFHGEPDVSSYRFEPEFAFVKPATDVALIGHACARARNQTEALVTLRVADLTREVLVSGDRAWESRWLGKRPSAPAAFEKIPLVWERAFGGWDRSAADATKHSFEPRNPVGVGYRAKFASFEEGAKLPNLEAPDERLTSWTGRVTPAGFGFVGPNWMPRAKFAGTYDEAWSKSRKPKLPSDFDRRFFNSAAPGLTAKGFLAGDESVAIDGVAPTPLKFALPGERPPRCRLTFRHKDDELLEPRLDSVVLDMDRMRVVLTWRAHTGLRDGPLDVRSFLVAKAGDALWTRATVAR